ncbi:MAG: amidohydrolase family protein [Candidatus Tectomicrobia bacterium]|uniref:Amidohydrolase family protein n=1 Tax=Tectimicrobiota bacterium TaxID=2528274 RepID=A0A933GMG5_UNCTE|nr:amidohydrolase family protein [Candidatus Tectomicrobia bacterium]
MDRLNIHCAQWVVPVTSPLITEGAVVIRSGRITDFGERDWILKNYAGDVHEHGQGAILPALANTHTHLELSILKNQIKGKTNFVDWVREVVQIRSTLNQEEMRTSINAALKALTDSGTLLIAEVTNTGLAVPVLGKSILKGLVFLELLGFSKERSLPSFESGKSFLDSAPELSNFALALSPHAVYSVHQSLFRAIKNHNRVRGLLSTVHVAESKDELYFLNRRESGFKQFLVQRGVWEKNWTPPGRTPVAYLDEIGFLDESTICVHLTQVTDEDIKILSVRKAKISVCLRSNLHTEVGLPPLYELLKEKFSVSLGTDSLASNEDLNLFGEMLAIRKYFPKIKGEQILAMATINGARVLNLDRDFGSIEKGKKAPLIFVRLDHCSEETIIDAILLSGYEEKVSWLFD